MRLGAYAARSCPVKTQWDVIRPCEPAPDPPFLVELGRRGVDFEADVFAELVTLHPDATVIDRTAPREERERRTREALDAGARLVLGPRLPHDPASGRVGEPDLLVHAGTTGYLPVDVKHHRTLDDEGTDLRGVLALVALGHDPMPVRPKDAGEGGSERGDLLQLAHYWRMLEDLRLASDMGPRGAIVGRERVVVGYDLTEPRFNGGAGTGGREGPLGLYDVEYAERHRIATAAAALLAEPDGEPPIAPVWFSECPNCRWREHCGEMLEERQDVSLLPRVGRPAWEALRRIDADTIPALAALPTSQAVEGMTTSALTKASEHARARVGAEVAYRRPGVERVTVERADVELDVDMENVEEGAYLWGVHVIDRTGSSIVTDGYHAFVDWDADAAVAGGRAFGDFWAWLSDVRRDCARRGVNLRAFCWHAPAENRWLRAGASALGLDDEVDAFIASEEWVDLLRVFDAQLITGRASGLKVVAPLLGFAWEDDDPSGAASMLWWQQAVDAQRGTEEREEARARLLAYNADDVRATLHVRDWMERNGSSVPELPGP